jgi:hypothetical protein
MQYVRETHGKRKPEYKYRNRLSILGYNPAVTPANDQYTVRYNKTLSADRDLVGADRVRGINKGP